MNREVIIWRNTILPGSETFVANQAAGLRRWRPVFAGLDVQANPFGVRPELDFAPRAAPARSAASPRTAAADLPARLERALFVRRGIAPRLERRLRQPSVGLVHAHFALDATYVLPAARRANCPLVVTAHGFDVTVHRDRWDARYAAAFAGLIAYADRFIAVSEFIAERLRDLGVPASRIVVHRIGIPIPPSPPAPDPAHPRRGVLFVGRLVEKKGAADLIEALAAMPEAARAAPVRLIGDGPLRPELEALARERGVEVDFLGAQPPEVVSAELERAAVFCVPSKTAANGDREGLPMVFPEAGAAELPAVTYASGGNAEGVLDGETGRVLLEGDVAGLSRALADLLSNPAEARRLGLQARRRVEASFDVREQCARLEEIYDSVARPA